MCRRDRGTTTVKADGGMMIANKGSEFSMSNGDNPGVAGGVKSSTFMKESTWILYSFDVKMDGKNACRLSDKKFQNHENTVDLAGEVRLVVAAHDQPLMFFVVLQVIIGEAVKTVIAQNLGRQKLHLRKEIDDALSDGRAGQERPAA